MFLFSVFFSVSVQTLCNHTTVTVQMDGIAGKLLPAHRMPPACDTDYSRLSCSLADRGFKVYVVECDREALRSTDSDPF